MSYSPEEWQPLQIRGFTSWGLSPCSLGPNNVGIVTLESLSHHRERKHISLQSNQILTYQLSNQKRFVQGKRTFSPSCWFFFSHQQWKGPTVSKLSAITLLVKCKSLSCVWLFATPWTQVHGILQPRILEWVAFLFSRGFSHPRDRTQVSRIAGRFFTSWATREAQESLSLLQWIFPTQESNQGLLHCRWILYQLSN